MEDESSDQLPVRRPVCPDCMSPMLFVMSVPDTTYRHLRHVRCACDCGRASNQVIDSAQRLKLIFRQVETTSSLMATKRSLNRSEMR